jgi:hypothetical protein
MGELACRFDPTHPHYDFDGAPEHCIPPLHTSAVLGC